MTGSCDDKAFPTKAERIRRLIRETVARPSTLPAPNGMFGGLTQLRWCRYETSDGKQFCDVCPMGLLPHAKANLPVRGYQFETASLKYPPLYDAEVDAFAVWWDNQKDAKAAVETVWGPS